MKGSNSTETTTVMTAGIAPGITTFTDADVDAEDNATNDVTEGAEDRGDILETDTGAEDAGDMGEEEDDDALDKNDLLPLDEVDKDDGAETDKSPMIPKPRFDEVNNSRKSALEENNRLKALLEQHNIDFTEDAASASAAAGQGDNNVAEAFDFAAKQQEQMEALVDGDTELAAEIGLEINKALQAQILKQAETIAAQKVGRVKDEEQAQVIAAEAVEKYPFLGENGDERAINRVLAVRNRLIEQGMSISKALKTAIDEEAPIFAELYALKNGETQGSKGTDRNRAALKHNAAAANQQPPNTGQLGTGTRTTDGRALDPIKMSEAEFESLPEADKKRLRGDVI